MLNLANFLHLSMELLHHPPKTLYIYPKTQNEK